MLYKKNFEKSKERLIAFWDQRIIDRCCFSIVAKNGYNCEIPTDSIELEDYYTNPFTAYKRVCKKFETVYLGGEALPSVMPFFGTAGHGAYFDIKYKFADDTIWFFPIIEDYLKNTLRFNKENELFVKQKKFISELSKMSQDEFFVAMPDNCGSLDALAQLRGTDNLLIDMYEENEDVFINLKKIIDVLKKTNQIFFDLTKDNNKGGSINQWMNTYHNGRHMQLQADLSCMISTDMYEKYVLPELIATSETLDASVYHLDGIEQIKHLDLILSVPKIKAIQWTPVVGQPKTSEYLHIFKKIQNSGKSLILFPHYSELQTIMDNLVPNGLYLCVQDVDDIDTALKIEKILNKYTAGIN